MPDAIRAAASELVKSFLRACEEGDLARAKSMLAPEFSMIFPGDQRFRTLEQRTEASRRRYKSAVKSFDRIDVADQGDGSHVVYIFGYLNGELLSGETFSSIRYIDRFTVRGGKIEDQTVWNDMAEVLGDKLKK